MLQVAKGVELPFPEKIREEYQLFSNCVLFHLSIEKAAPMLRDFIDQEPEPFFLALHLPLSEQEEKPLRKSPSDPFHERVYYLDGQSREQMLALLEQYGALLLEDGLSQFSVGSHVTQADFFVQKYKLIAIYDQDPGRFAGLLQHYGLRETERLLTAWDTFTRDSPGCCMRIEMDGMSVYEIREQLAERGLYAAKIVEE